jgi:predicted AlkP superfamily phosphohydrolase/phosphomutase
MGRLLIIGLDGATFDVIEPLINEGKLPTLRRILNEGTRAILESTPFPSSAPAWTSCLTGTNPGKHGIFGFGVRDDQNNYRFQLCNSTSVKAKTLPRLLSEYAKYSVLINDPMSFPPYAINGTMISGVLTPQGESFTFPREFQQELLTAIPEYTTEVSPFNFDLKNKAGKQAFADTSLGAIKARTKAAKLLMEREKWDFFMVVFTELDRIQHHFWAEMDESHFFHPQTESSLSQTIPRTYQALDESVAILLDGLPTDAQVFVISDHGSGPYENIFFMNKFLQERGFLKLKSKDPEKIARLLSNVFRKIPGAQLAYEQLRRMKRREQPYVTPGGDSRRTRQKIDRWVIQEIVDWGQTRIFADFYGVRINMRGREPNGIVMPGRESEKVLDELTEQLLTLRFPHNGKPVFTQVKRRWEVYVGPFADKAPDLITFMDVGNPHPAYLTGTLFRDSLVTTGGHQKDGIFVAWGPGICQNHSLGRANIVDVAPTATYTVGIPLTPEMDGRVLDIFDQGLDPLRLSDRRGTSMLSQEREMTYTSEQELEIKDKLKSLGYLD